jgi:hypothetical protein
MDPKPDVIREQIQQQRQELANNVRHLEDRVRDMADWKAHFQENPGIMLGVSLAGGLFLSWLTRGRYGELRDCKCYCDE